MAAVQRSRGTRRFAMGGKGGSGQGRTTGRSSPCAALGGSILVAPPCPSGDNPVMRFAIKACAISTLLAIGLLTSSYFLKGRPIGQWVDALLYVLLGAFLLALALPQS